ncbi:MAG: mechanosensitive ion channel, partial [Deltaproteobacteria bacterium]|nr:mechanosensitive ion channel [Deltaproteobacteria bacterium]
AWTVAVSELADSSVNFVVRPWVKGSDYWPTRFALIENIKLSLDAAGISIPYPQRDVHMHQAA